MYGTELGFLRGLAPVELKKKVQILLTRIFEGVSRVTGFWPFFMAHFLTKIPQNLRGGYPPPFSGPPNFALFLTPPKFGQDRTPDFGKIPKISKIVENSTFSGKPRKSSKMGKNGTPSQVPDQTLARPGQTPKSGPQTPKFGPLPDLRPGPQPDPRIRTQTPDLDPSQTSDLWPELWLVCDACVLSAG